MKWVQADFIQRLTYNKKNQLLDAVFNKGLARYSRGKCRI